MLDAAGGVHSAERTDDEPRRSTTALPFSIDAEVEVVFVLPRSERDSRYPPTPLFFCHRCCLRLVLCEQDALFSF